MVIGATILVALAWLVLADIANAGAGGSRP
jgi:hypothetical protein